MADLVNERISFETALANLLDLYGIGGAEGGGTILASRLSIINLVKAKLDRIIPEGEGLQFSVEGETNVSDPTNLLINAVLNEAAKRVLLNAPLHILDPVKSAEVAGTEDATDSKIGYIVLANNFLRFVSIKMANWKMPVFEVIRPEIDVEEYAMQQNEFVRGGTARPKVAFSMRTIEGTQKRVVEYYSVEDSHNIDWFYYIQETEAENLQVNLIDSLTWYAAGMIMQITENVELANSAFAQEQLCYKNL